MHARSYSLHVVPARGHDAGDATYAVGLACSIEAARRTGSRLAAMRSLARDDELVCGDTNAMLKLLRPRIHLPPAGRQRAVSVAGDHAGRDPRLRRRDRHGVAAARIRRRQDRRRVLVADPRARRHGAAEHRRLPQRARGGDHREAGARIVRHLLDQAGGDRRQRHAAAGRGRPGRGRGYPDQGRLRGVSLLHRGSFASRCGWSMPAARW